MQILATGANGQVGWELARKGAEYGFDIIALNRSSLDVCDFQAVKKVIQNHNRLYPLLYAYGTVFTTMLGS